MWAEVSEPPADSGRGEPAGLGGLLPRPPQVGGGLAQKADLGVRGDYQPGPALTGLGSPQLRPGSPEGLLHQPEKVLDVEPSQKRLPAHVDVLAVQAGGGRPESERERVASAGQAVDL
ncbi:hypothetical protein TUSST3_39500 [Streptomyces sp. TUS-ST3]|nr:hypothetical protein TUSST3_39500 [Streptomyces sp. TUS-ST3]